jgi:hypothetical protein
MQSSIARVRAGAAATFLASTCLCPARLEAGDLQALLFDASYAKPVRWNVGGSLFFSNEHDVKNSDGGSGLIVGGSVGPGGMKAWGGTALLHPLGGDLRAVFTRTWNHPRDASANSTYVGGEVGWGGLGLRLSLGYGKRVGAPSTDRDHIVTWGVGLEIPWFR